MSHPVTKLRRRIDLEEFRLRQLSSTDQRDGEPPAESPAIVAGVADEEMRSWRPRVFVVVAIFIAGMAAIGLRLMEEWRIYLLWQGVTGELFAKNAFTDAFPPNEKAIIVCLELRYPQLVFQHPLEISEILLGHRNLGADRDT
jgi:hypothetical protein